MPGSARCQVPGCRANLGRLVQFYQRYRCCEKHSRAEQVELACGPSRFCQLCGRFQPLSDFDDKRRSCRERLQKHNARRKAKQDAEAELEQACCMPAEPAASPATPHGTWPQLPDSEADAASTDSGASCQEQEQQAAAGSMAVLDNETLARELCLHHLMMPTAGSKRSHSESATTTNATPSSSAAASCERPRKRACGTAKPKTHRCSTDSASCDTTDAPCADLTTSPWECMVAHQLPMQANVDALSQHASVYDNAAQQAAWLTFLNCMPQSVSASGPCPTAPAHHQGPAIKQEEQAVAMGFDTCFDSYEHFDCAALAPQAVKQEPEESVAPEIIALWQEWSGGPTAQSAQDRRRACGPSPTPLVLNLAAPLHQQMQLCAF